MIDYPHLATGKVRDIYRVDETTLLFVASDRISAFDFVLPSVIDDKGAVLTAMSVFWFELLGDLVGNHVIAYDDPRIPDQVRGRALLVRELEMVPVECVVRGYLTGSGLADYRRDGAVCGVALPRGLVEASQLPTPIFTPASKAEIGAHDENVSFQTVVNQMGCELAEQLRTVSVALYQRAADHALAQGIILADTKFEFGIDPDGALVLADEVLTPDSSRFWPADSYQVGQAQPSYDKQYVRDWLLGPDSGWDRRSGAAPPALPTAVVAATRDRYVQAYQVLSGRSFADWLPAS